MLAQCLMKNPADRPSAERLLAHRFFARRAARDAPALVAGLLLRAAPAGRGRGEVGVRVRVRAAAQQPRGGQLGQRGGPGAPGGRRQRQRLALGLQQRMDGCVRLFLGDIASLVGLRLQPAMFLCCIAVPTMVKCDSSMPGCHLDYLGDLF